MSVSLETFNPSALSRSDSIPTTSLPPSKTAVAPSGKPLKGNGGSGSQRIDFEPLYSELKSLIGHNWSTYHDAVSKFVQGRISGAEFAHLTDSFLLATPQVEHAHNSLICAILYNISRDKPDHAGPAIWVTAASDKPSASATSKPHIASDAGEQRLKTEVMSLPARDRRRLKGTAGGTDKGDDGALLKRKYEDYYQAGKVRAPENVPPSAGGLNKTNWDLEIRKRYTQPLFSETLEFPDASSIYSRMIPICYEESVASGSSMSCAELVAVGTETYVKDILGSVFNRTRANRLDHEIGTAGGVSTSAFLRQREREEHDFRHGKIQKGRESGLLPVESREAMGRQPLGMVDLKVAGGVGRGLWNGMPLIGSRVAEASYETELDEWLEERRDAAASTALSVKDPPRRQHHHHQHTDEGSALHGAAGIKEIAQLPSGYEMDLDYDNDDCGWQGARSTDRTALNSLLDDCLSVRA